MSRQSWPLLQGGQEAGDRLAYATLKDGAGEKSVSLFSVLDGTRYALLLLPGDEPEAAASLLEIAADMDKAYPGIVSPYFIVKDAPPKIAPRIGNVPVLVDSGSVQEKLRATEATVVLVRPDGYIGYRCQPADGKALRQYADGFLMRAVAWMVIEDRREVILQAAMATLREFGFAGFTQPRVAKRADIRQSHLTYYFPTRLALIEAVGRLAVDNQLKSLDQVTQVVASGSAAIKAIAGMVVRHENTRVLMALAQAADQEPSLRGLFRELADGIAARLTRLFEKLGFTATEEQVGAIHALSVGLAIVDLATQRPVSRRRVEAILEAMFSLISRRT